MYEWIDQLSDWMQEKEETGLKETYLSELLEEVNRTAVRTDSLLEMSDQLQAAYSHLLGKVDHVSH